MSNKEVVVVINNVMLLLLPVIFVHKTCSFSRNYKMYPMVI